LTIKAIREPLAHLLHANLDFDEAVRMKKMLQIFADQSVCGLIVFNSRFQILYHNAAATDICEQLTDPFPATGNPVQAFLKTVLAANPLAWIRGMSKRMALPTLRQVELKVSPMLLDGMSGQKDGRLFMASFSCLPDAHDETRRPSGQEGLGFLTIRELEVLHLLINGDTNKQIADKLHVSVNTVKKHVKSIFRKTGACSRTVLISRIYSDAG
jgi:DNA-binding CsgD family transcriptional regulator